MGLGDKGHLVDFERRHRRPVTDVIRESLVSLYELEVEGKPVYTSREVDVLRRHTPGKVFSEAKRGVLKMVIDDEEVAGVGGLVPYSKIYDPHIDGFDPDPETTGVIICAYVRPDKQRKGVFYRLAPAIVEIAAEKGYTTLFSYAVMDPMVEKLYGKIGCENIGTVERPIGVWGLRTNVPFFTLVVDIEGVRFRKGA